MQQSDRLTRLIDRHRRLSRLEPAREATDVGALVRGVVELRRVALLPRQRLELVLGAELPNCEVDSDLLVTALENLIANAFEAIEDDGRVVVRALRGEGDAPELVLEVEDDGKGMDPRQLERATDGSFTSKPRDPRWDRPSCHSAWEAGSEIKGSDARIPLESRGFPEQVRFIGDIPTTLDFLVTLRHLPTHLPCHIQ